MPRFTWDPAKEAINFRKHGVWFDEAESVFRDRDRLEMPDRLYSHHEPRQRSLGWSNLVHLLVVITSERDPLQPRIISAWRASKRERNAYERRRR